MGQGIIDWVSNPQYETKSHNTRFFLFFFFIFFFLFYPSLILGEGWFVWLFFAECNLDLRISLVAFVHTIMNSIFFFFFLCLWCSVLCLIPLYNSFSFYLP
jgi:hypothetical protein